jgi:hypothetical protein
LDASASYDPDSGPEEMKIFWEVYKTPYEPELPPFVIQDPTAKVHKIETNKLKQGEYQFILSVSDRHAIAQSIWNITLV